MEREIEKGMGDDSLKWVLRQRRGDRDRGEWWRGSNNIMVCSYISVVLWREVWSFPTCAQPTLLSIFPSAAHVHLAPFIINIHLFHPCDTHSSLTSPILTLLAPFHSLALSDHLSPPLLNQASLIYQKPSLHYLHPFFSPPHPFSCTTPAELLCLGLSRTDRNSLRRCCGRRLITRGLLTSQKPIKGIGRKRGWYPY